MKRLAVLPVLAVLTSACGADDADAPPTGPIGFSVLHYELALDLTTRAATATATIEVTEAGDCIGLPLRARLTSGNVTFDGVPAAGGTFEDGVLTACGPGHEIGDVFALAAQVEIPEETWGGSQVGFSVSTDLEGNPFTYLVSWVGGCDRFAPCDRAPDRFATYRFVVTHAAGTRVLCPGVVTPGETETVCAFDHPGGPTYSTYGIVASPSWTEHDLGDWDGVAVTAFDMPSAGLLDALDPDIPAGFLAFMQERFGPYPYGDELRLIVGPTYWSGFEHPGNIVLNDRLASPTSAYTDPVSHVTNHEIAHQWAGDQTTLAGTYDFVWKEAMAEYLAFVYEDEVLDDRRSARAWKQFSRGAAFHPVPAEEPPLLDYYGDVYGPGPLILFRQIEALFDRAAVMDALAMLLGTQRAIGVSDVQAALEATTGADLGGYFETWVYGEGAPSWPTYTVGVSEGDGGSYTVTVTQNADRPHGAAFAVRLTGEVPGTGDEAPTPVSTDVWIDFGVDGAASVTETVTPDFVVTGHVFDPEGHTLGYEAPSAAEQPIVWPRVNPWVAARERVSRE